MEPSFPSFPYGFLDALVNELDTPEVIGITLGGSYARGEARRQPTVMSIWPVSSRSRPLCPSNSISIAVGISSVLPISP